MEKVQATGNGARLRSPLLDAMHDARVFEVRLLEDGRFEVAEMCDEYFAVVLTGEELAELFGDLVIAAAAAKSPQKSPQGTKNARK